MPILIDIYRERYEAHDPEEDICEPDSRETLETDSPYTFRQLVELLESHFGETSDYPTSGDVRTWVTLYKTNDGTRDYFETGAEENDSVHFSRANPPRNAKYWRWALRAAGFRIVD